MGNPPASGIQPVFGEKHVNGNKHTHKDVFEHRNHTTKQCADVADQLGAVSADPVEKIGQQLFKADKVIFVSGDGKIGDNAVDKVHQRRDITHAVVAKVIDTAHYLGYHQPRHAADDGNHREVRGNHGNGKVHPRAFDFTEHPVFVKAEKRVADICDHQPDDDGGKNGVENSKRL